MASAVPLFNGLKHLSCPKEAGDATCTTPGCLFGHRSDNSNAIVQRPQSHSLDGVFDLDEDAKDAGEDARPPKKRQRTVAGDRDELESTTSDVPQVTNYSDLSLPNLANKVNKSDIYDPLSPPTVGDAVTSSSSTQRTPTAPIRFAQAHPLSQSNTATTPQRSAASTSGSSSSLQTPKTQTTNRFAPSSATGKPLPASSSATPLASSSPAASSTASPQPKAQLMAQDKASEAKRPRKYEALNPRLLKSAPAAHSQRHQLLTLLHKELVRLNGEVSARSKDESELKPLVKSAQELIWMALDMEEKVARENAPVYRNVMGHLVMSYKRMNADARIAEQRKLDLEGNYDQKNPTVVAPIVIKTGLTPSEEVEVLHTLLTPITNLEQYGYVSAPPSEQQIADIRQTVEWSRGWEECAQCTARFQVFPGRHPETGLLATGGDCTHHPGKAYFPERQPGHTGLNTKKYRCCTQDVGESPGCHTSESGHVWKTSDPKRLALLWNFVETPANDSPDVKKAVAFDCEMGYTVHGMELIRLTVTSWPDGAELIDILVQPIGEVLDLNSKYSGVFPSDLADALPWAQDSETPAQQPDERKILRKVPSPQSARDLLFSIINPDTILVGHGLENDLNAMRIVHPKIVDTILLYPHRRGLPIRISLKALMELHLNRKIQTNLDGGHDSAEDARAAGDLVRLKVQKKWIVMWAEGWRFLDGALCKPGRKRQPLPAAKSMNSSEESLDTEEGGVMLTGQFLEASGS